MRTLGRFLWLCITIIMIVVAILLTASNETATTVHLWPLSRALTAPLGLVLVTAFLAGGLIGGLFVWGQALMTRARLWRLQRQFDKLQAQTQKLARSDSSGTLPPNNL